MGNYLKSVKLLFEGRKKVNEMMESVNVEEENGILDYYSVSDTTDILQNKTRAES